MDINVKWPGEALLLRMWDTLISNGVGSLLQPWQIKRVGRAQAEVRRDEMILIAEAEREIERLRAPTTRLLASGAPHVEGRTGDVSGASIPLLPSDEGARSPVEIAQAAAAAEQLRREVNVARAITHASATLASDTSPPPEQKVDDDWLHRWRDAASGVSGEHLQHLWGRVLAGEVKSPGDFSLRTVDFLRNLSAEEARLIERLAPCVLNNFVSSDDHVLKSAGLSMNELLALQELGVLSGIETNGFILGYDSVSSDRFERLLMFQKHGLWITGPSASLILSIRGYRISPVGSQVLALADADPNVSYLESFASTVCAQGFTVELAQVTARQAANVNFNRLRVMCSPPTPNA